jgi:ABC-type molybdate transport system substrate-binding protein
LAQVNVLISGGFSGAYEELLPEFERASGIKVATGSGASQGTGPQTIAAQFARGVPSDVVILSREGLDELIAAKRDLAVLPTSEIMYVAGVRLRGQHRTRDPVRSDVFSCYRNRLERDRRLHG